MALRGRIHRSSVVQPESPARKRVLVVDDEPDIRTLIRAALELAGKEKLECIESPSGEDALVHLDDADPDIICLDLMMPGRDGIETAAAIREQRPDQSIILFSAYVTDDVRRRAATVGIEHVVLKSNVVSLFDLILAQC